MNTEPNATARRSRLPWMLLLIVALTGAVALLISAGVLLPISALPVLALVLTALFWRIRVHLASILLVFVAALLVGMLASRPAPKMRPDRLDASEGDQLSQKWAASGQFRKDLPIVIHLVLDEMMSSGAMTEDLPKGSETREELLQFADKHSFRMFDSVYSRYYHTSDTIPRLMNADYVGDTTLASYAPLPFNADSRSYAVPSNAYFRDMADRGYRTAVFQATYMNFCANKDVDLCQTFDSFDPAGRRASDPDAPILRVRLWETFLRAYAPSYTSDIGKEIVGRAYGLRGDQAGVIGDDGGRHDVSRFPEWFDRFARFAAQVPRGTHVFGHFLVPHSPYVLLEDCVVSGTIDSGYALSKYPVAEREAKRRDYYERYFTQVGCVQRKLNELMSAIEQSDNFRDAVIIIHGDHGSRISAGDVLEDQSGADFIDNYATFFAVRAPAVPAGVDCEQISLPQVFRRYAPSGRAAAGSADPLPVVVGNRAGAKVEVPMPRFGCGDGRPVS